MTTSPAPAQAAPVERLVFFTDAAVAIALTLLILPLLDGVAEAARKGMDAFGYLGDNLAGVSSFALSFVIIARFWRSHHRLFSSIDREPPGIFWLGMLWLASIVFLPVATAMTGAMPAARPQLVIYIGTMMVAVVAQTAMAELAYRNPQAWAEGAELTRGTVRASWAMVILMAAALVLALLWPSIGYWALLLLLLARPMKLLIDRIAGSDGAS